jgi:site-specific DNA-methyltransferase (adenine-specific)
MKFQTISVADLSLDPSNVRKHSRRNLDAIKASLRKFGQQKPIVVNAKGIVLAGNGTLTAAKELGWTEIQIVRTELAGVEATAFAIADNRTAELAEWEEDKLSQVLQSLKVEDADLLAATGYDAAEVDKMSKAEVTEDEAPEPPAEPITKAGDLWILGEHRVMCGDSTKRENVARLMSGDLAKLVVTDPPYGVDYQGGVFSKRDKLAGDQTADLYGPILKLAYEFSDAKAAVYLWHSDGKAVDVFAALDSAKYVRRITIIWNKNIAQFGALSAQYKQKHEPCHYLFKKGESPRWFGPTNETTVWDIDRNQTNEHHPTEKPIGIMARPIQNSSEPTDIILDFFLGSGTTLIAAEQLGRKCYGMEISPSYCDVIAKRWENLTGKKAVLDKPTT